MIQRGKFCEAGPERPTAGHGRYLRLTFELTVVLGLGLALGACSTMSDMGEATTEGVSKAAHAMNPFNWFGNSEPNEASDRAKQDRAVASTEPKTGVKSAPRDQLAQRATERDEERYPKLSTVPDRPREAASTRAERARAALREGLIADTANAEYTDNELRARTDPAANAQRADSARSNERIGGEPPAVPAPTMPVASSPVAPIPSVAASPERTTVASASPRIVPPPVAPARATQRNGYGMQQAAAASAAPVTAAAPSVSPAPLPSTAPTTPAPRQHAALAETTPPPADPEPRAVLKTIQVATIYFNDGSSHLSSNDRRVLEQVAAAARQTGGRLRIIGHSSMAAAGGDAERAAMVNYKVSLGRANAVATELVRKGVPGNQMQVMAEGARNPIYAESSSIGAAGNRRTEIYLDFYERL